jgi:DNA-binding NtrC family response regulator
MTLSSSPWPQLRTATSSVVAHAPPLELLSFVLPNGAEVSFAEGLTIGQARDNRIVLEDACVSRRHCVVERNNRRWLIRDLSSKNGTWVNDLKVTEAPLQPGATVAVGGSRLRVVAQPSRGSPLVGSSAAMQRVRAEIRKLAPTSLPVLIVGETGTGKELVARALHDQSGRAGPFIALNCGAIATELVESELFGHERGAFTGANNKRAGLFQEADGGTLFLDEIGELPLSMQPRLLRALEVGAVRAVGATREQRVQVRVVAATHVDLQHAVQAATFRQDLFYRLDGAVINTPSLRARVTDIGELAEQLLRDDRPGARLDDSALEALQRHSWPGNVRELRNVLRRAAALGGPVLSAEDLALRAAPAARGASDQMLALGGRFLDLERAILSHALTTAGGNKRAAAQALGIPKSTLCDKAKRYGIG